MIDPCPICGQVPEPVKASYEAFTIACCGLSATDPWFISVLLKWRDVVTMYGKVKKEGIHGIL